MANYLSLGCPIMSGMLIYKVNFSDLRCYHQNLKSNYRLRDTTTLPIMILLIMKVLTMTIHRMTMHRMTIHRMTYNDFTYNEFTYNDNT